MNFYLISSFMLLLFIGMSGFILNRCFESPESVLLRKKIVRLSAQLDQIWQKSQKYESELYSTYFPNDNLYRTILNIDTLSLSIRSGGTGGSAREGSYNFSSDIATRLERQINMLDVQLKIQRNSYVTVFNKAIEYRERLNRLPAIRPLTDKDVYYISSYFGSRNDPFSNEGEEFHTGVDFVATIGTNVYAVADGTVTLSKNSRTGYGNEIVINHDFGFSSRYAHLEKILVKEGEKVQRGQLIGKVGSSGRSTGPHLHYEVRYDNKAVNPLLYIANNLTPDEYAEIIALANN